MGRKKKGDSVDAISQQIAKIVLAGAATGSSSVKASMYAPTSVIRVASAGAHRKFLDKQFHKATDPLKASASKLFSMPSSDVIIAGCPSASSVVNAFEAASVHSELGRMLKGFASAVVDLFAKGPAAVADVPEKWVAAMDKAPEKFVYELQGFSALFSFLYFQVVQSQRKYMDAVKKAMLPDSVASIDVLMETLSTLRDALTAPPVTTSSDAENDDEITIPVGSAHPAPSDADATKATRSPARRRVAPVPPPPVSDGHIPVNPPAPRRHAAAAASQARHNQATDASPEHSPAQQQLQQYRTQSPQRTSPHKRRDGVPLPTSLMEFGSHDTLPSRAVGGEAWALFASSPQSARSHQVQRLSVRALPAMEDAVGRGVLPTAALSTGALLAQGIPFSPLARLGEGHTDHVVAVAELRPKLFHPQMPMPRVAGHGRNGAVGGALQSLSARGVTQDDPISVVGPLGGQPDHRLLAHHPHVLRTARIDRDREHREPLLPHPQQLIALMHSPRTTHHNKEMDRQHNTTLVTVPSSRDERVDPAPRGGGGWKEFWEEEEKRKLQQQISGCRSVTDYRPRDLARYAADMDAMRRDVLGSVREEEPCTFDEEPSEPTC